MRGMFLRKSLRGAALAGGFLAASGFAFDVRDPLGKDGTEVGMGVRLESLRGAYDSDGNFYDWGDLGLSDGFHPRATGFPIRLKYGLGGGMDVEAVLEPAISNEDAGDAQGLTQPDVALKYLSAWGGGAFARLTLPFATGDFDNGHLDTQLEAGILARRRFGNFRLTGLLGYATNFKGINGTDVLLRPEIVLLDRHGVYFEYQSVGVEDDAGNEGSLLVLTPGIRIMASNRISIEAHYRWTAAGEQAPAFSQVAALVYWGSGGL